MYIGKLLAFVLLLIASSAVKAQVESASVTCPVEQGVYARVSGDWKELPVETSRRANHTIGNLAHDNAVAYYPGAKSPVTLGNQAVICVSGSALGSTLSLAKTQEKKDERRVLVGTISMITGFTFRIDKKYSVPFELTRDSNRNYVVHAAGLASGQYMLYLLQGSSLASVPPAFSFGVDAK